MGREVRRVPADWQHPRFPVNHYEEHRRGAYIPLHEGGYAESAAEWDEEWAQFQKGLVRSYSGEEKWRAREPEAGPRYTDYAGERPSPDEYMPDWPEDQRTHFMMYEDTSEGTPISPAFATPEELARWLADTGASSFADMTATYEQWLSVCKGGWAPSMVISGGVMESGVAAMASVPHD